jgi:hypothetical protein
VLGGGPPPSTRTSTGSRSPGTRSAPGLACPTRLPPSCCASSAPARASRRQSPAPPDPGRLPAPAAPLVRGGQADCRRGVPAREYCPAGAAWRGRRLDRHREGVATYRDGHPATGRPARGQCPAARSADCLRPTRRASAGCPGQWPGTVSRISRPLSLIREPVTPPHRQLIRVPIRVPADSGAPFQWRTCWTRR